MGVVKHKAADEENETNETASGIIAISENSIFGMIHNPKAHVSNSVDVVLEKVTETSNAVITGDGLIKGETELAIKILASDDLAKSIRIPKEGLLPVNHDAHANGEPKGNMKVLEPISKGSEEGIRAAKTAVKIVVG